MSRDDLMVVAGKGLRSHDTITISPQPVAGKGLRSHAENTIMNARSAIVSSACWMRKMATKHEPKRGVPGVNSPAPTGDAS